MLVAFFPIPVSNIFTSVLASLFVFHLQGNSTGNDDVSCALTVEIFCGFFLSIEEMASKKNNSPS